MSEYDAFRGLSESKEDARKELLKKANDEFLERQKILELMRKSQRINRLLILLFLVIIPILYQITKRHF